MGEDRGNLYDSKWLVSNELFELLSGNDFFSRQKFFAFDAGKIIEVFPNVVVAAFVQVDAVFNSDNQIVELSISNLNLLQFNGALHYGLMGKCQALGL